jgi:hypothetical protein
MALIGSLASSACHRRSISDSASVAALAQSRGAQEAFRPLRQRFVGAERTQRALLEANLTWFVANYPKDGLTPLAKVYLALIAVDKGQIDRARELVEDAKKQPSGTTRDLSELVEGAILLRQKAAAQAFEQSLPLVGKLIDPYARVLLDEQIVVAGIAAKRWYEAVAYMDLWLRDAPEEDATSVRAAVRRALESIPGEPLELMLHAMRTAGAGTGYGNEIRKAVVARLAGVAIEQQDTALARRLVESSSGNSLGEAAEGLEELASSGGAAVVDGRSIGFLVSTGKSQLGERAAEVLSGVVDALRLTGEAGAPDHVRLTTRDEREGGSQTSILETKRIELALKALASQGASVLIAGLDPPQAQIAAAFAESTRIPVILLSPANETKVRPPVFVLGDSSDRAVTALVESMVGRGARSIAPVGGSVPKAVAGRATFLEVASCNATASQAGESRFPVADWRAARVDHLLLLGDAACASDAMDAVLAGRLSGIRAAVGLEAAVVAGELLRVPSWVATAGNFPLKRGDATSAMSGFKKRNGKAPSWFAALGHDAAVLARLALRTLPQDRADDKDEVERRHDAARIALGRAEADLWTTDARGFAGQNVIAREIGVIEVK